MFRSEMVGLKDQAVCSESCCNVKKPASEAYEMLKVLRDDVMGRKHSFEWCPSL